MALQRKLLHVSVLAAVGWLWIQAPACGGCGDEPPTGPIEVAISIAHLDEETQVPFFAMGHRSDWMPYGGKGLITPADAGVTRSAAIVFQDVAEGESYRVDYVGYHQLSSFPPRPPASQPWLCYYERATKIARVVSGASNVLLLEPDPVTGRCTFLAGDRYVVNPNYQADAYDPSYGSIDGENVLALLVHGAPAGATLHFKACDTVDPSCTAPFGVFTTLPDGREHPWPAHTGSGWPREVTVDADGSGDAMVLLVVKPGEDPKFWEIEVDYPVGTTPASEVFRVRISNGNRIDVEAE